MGETGRSSAGSRIAGHAAAPSAATPLRRARRSVPRAALALAALLWLAALALPTTSRGTGSSLSGHALADLIGSGALAAFAPRWLGPMWYLMPLGGAVVLATAPLAERRTIAWPALAAALLASGAALLSTALMTGLRPARFGPGSWCAMSGTCLALAGIAATAASRQRPGSPDELL